jgi:large subunit ribosomal protein L18
MNQQKAKLKRRQRRRNHVRLKITGTPQRPRLSVHRSSKHIYAQLIDDLTGTTLASASSLAPEVRKEFPNGGNVKVATVVGKRLAEAAKAKGITLAAFDRGHYKFHGRVKALAMAANEAGLKCTEPKKPPKPEEAPPPKADKAPKEKAPKAEKADKGAEKPKKEKPAKKPE